MKLMILSLGIAIFVFLQTAHAHENHEMSDMSSMDMLSSNAHMEMTELRKPSTEDRVRAARVVEMLKQSLKKYEDYRVALDDGYKIFLPNVPLREYHFTNYRYGIKAAFTFDPAHPTSLLYRKTFSGYELIGAMFTAPKTATEDELNARVPLSVAQWHKHVNLCLPPDVEDMRRADWRKFGPKGSIVTEEECSENGGRWIPQRFGWMVHVYPFEKDPQKIWAPPMGQR
jgi:hypothetical protein